MSHLNPLWDLLFAALILSAALWYISEREARKSVSWVRQGSFLIGLQLAFILLVGPVPHAAIRTFWIHMK